LPAFIPSSIFPVGAFSPAGTAISGGVENASNYIASGSVDFYLAGDPKFSVS
jgi:hypothetical protein